jgi:NAD(P)H-hydrate repair Nnr-like enzyme with NAD(P)H-hydrate dehydratase domain
MLLLVGTIPIEDMPLTHGQCKYDKDKLVIGKYTLEHDYVTIGTAAMISAASATCQALGIDEPYATVIGDTGMGEGTLKMFEHLNNEIVGLKPDVLTIHYILPSREQFTKLVETVDAMDKKPFFIADAGALLNAKAIGLSKKFDLFTPDPGELSFLADQDAAHPAYVQHFIFEVDNTDVARLSKEAFEHGDTPRYMVVKAAIDHVIVDGEVVGVIKEPLVPALEAIGGTGDTITGIVSALIFSGLEPSDAGMKAAQINRYMGELASPTPATGIAKLIEHIPEAVKKVIK